MTTEAEAQVRLLAYYEDRLVLLADKVTAYEEELRTKSDPIRVSLVESQIGRLKREIDDVREKVRRLGESGLAGGCSRP